MTTTATNPNLATGVATNITDDSFSLAIPGTDYRILLQTTTRLNAPEGKRVSGVITAQARRIDKIRGGGAFLEPMEDRPRRAQGRVRAIDKARQTITVHTGAAPIVLKTNDAQRAEDFEIGEMVTLAVKPGASFTQSESNPR